MHKREVVDAELSAAALLISDFTIDALRVILRILPKFATEPFLSIVIGGRLDSSNCFKGTQRKTIFSKFSETFKIAVFRDIP